MNIALGYCWFETSLGYHLERAVSMLGHSVVYVGPGINGRQGYAEQSPLAQSFSKLSPDPDLFFWIDPAGRYFPSGIEKLDIPTACYLVDVHLGKWRKEAAKFFDVVFVAQKDYLDEYKQAVGHDQVYWLPLGAANDVHFDHHVPRVYDVGFVGNLRREHKQSGRARRLNLISSAFSINDYSRAYTPEETGEIYSQSKIVVNTSIDHDVTMRVFEGSACGAMVLTDGVFNGLDELFIPGKEIAVFTDDESMMQRIKYYLQHEDERASIARAGQERTLKEHAYTRRMEYALSKILSASFNHAALLRHASAAKVFRSRRHVLTHLHMLDPVLDDLRAQNMSPIRRLAVVAPVLARRLLR